MAPPDEARFARVRPARPDAARSATAARDGHAGRDLLDRCSEEAVRLLHANLTTAGVLAARRGAAADARAYNRVFGRDAAICALAMAGSGVPELERGAIAGLDALAAGQAANGQIPKFVDPDGADADFWYVGCIVATVWWLFAVDHVRRAGHAAPDAWAPAVERALQWLGAQEHPRFFLLQQNEASDWADMMPRSGFVLYTNALWHRVKCLYDLPQRDETRAHFESLFHPFGRDLPAYRRSRLLRHYAIRRQRHRGLYLSFVNLSFAGDEGDVFGNLLAIVYGLASDSRAHEIVEALRAERVAEPYPARAVTRPIERDHELWRAYMERHQQNHPQQYHNGGVWPFLGAFWVLALLRLGKPGPAHEELVKLARVNALDDWRFTEWFHGATLAPMGMAGQSWNAAMFLVARQAVERALPA
jgi:glycogen debranching enzyme